MEGWIWLALIVLGIVIEAASPQLVAIWFVFGGVAALVSSLLGADIWLQIIIAIAVSVICLIATKPLTKKIMNQKISRTNADRFIGQEGLVTTEIDDIAGVGRVSVLGASWAAFSPDRKTIPVGTKIKVEEIRGVKLAVTPINE